METQSDPRKALDICEHCQQDRTLAKLAGTAPKLLPKLSLATIGVTVNDGGRLSLLLLCGGHGTAFRSEAREKWGWTDAHAPIDCPINLH